MTKKDAAQGMTVELNTMSNAVIDMTRLVDAWEGSDAEKTPLRADLQRITEAMVRLTQWTAKATRH